MSSLDSGVEALMRSPQNRCFACGPGNPHGLQLRFEQVDGVVTTEFTTAEWQAGWTGVTHGGILATVLDEAMAYALFFAGTRGVTARLEIRYRSAVGAGERLRAEARVTREDRRTADVEARLLTGERVIAEARSRFMKQGPLTVEALVAQASYHASDGGAGSG